ncbi:alpha/beta fold hydrolase [Petroclostridium sp. X23]|uniref:alpha/beta hydrolase n=1 Tax=Petroclostridium sp. X23 TaxID=3045146 RepID=UPI0024AD9917|nr:alpha/beta fold hydrolase [Petroclostridium sp. X23]WHH60794.1 alpha/beta fold hydrolase [Petroclostridium sp. X23]
MAYHNQAGQKNIELNSITEPDIKKLLLKRIVKAVVIVLIICCLFMVVTPFAAIPIFLNQHVNYKGYATENDPLQDIYSASDYSLDETQMYFQTQDGLNVWCSEIYAEKPKAVIIYLTGIVQPSITYFYGHAAWMKENGYATILLEVRGHGQSDGNRICLGYKETNDVRAVVNYIKSQKKYKDVPIVLHGVSMGGAIAVNAFGQIDEIDGLIAMSAYSSFEDAAMDLAKQYHVPGFIRTIEKPLVKLALKTVFGNDTVNEIKPIEQIKNAGERPVLLVACTGDTNVPSISTERLKKANPNVQTWVRDSWEHFIVKNCDFKNMSQDDEYCKTILEFLNQFM